MKAIFVREHGGPDVLRVEDIPTPEPGDFEVLVRNQAIGVNFVDTQHRAGINFPIRLPFIPGTEAAGVVEAVGPGASLFQRGDRVAYAGYMGGDYAEYTVVPETRLVPIPGGVSPELAVTVLLQGMTAHCLCHSVYPVKAKDVILVQAATGGVARLLVQMAKQRGATVIGTVSSPEKADLARAIGADAVIVYTRADFEAETLRLTQGEGVHAVYDGVGRATFDKGIGVLRARGYLIVYGLSSGPVPPFDVNRLSGITGSGNKGSLFLTWATLNDYASNREDLLWRAGAVLQWAAEGSLRAPRVQIFPLTEAGAAHRLIESRRVAGKVLLLPGR